MSSTDNIDELTDEVCEELPYNPPVTEVKEKLAEYLHLGIDEDTAKQVAIDVFSIRREVLDELEFQESEIVVHDLPSNNRSNWQ